MISPDFEIHRLRSSLSQKNIPQEDIDVVCGNATAEINVAILEILNKALDESIT